MLISPQGLWNSGVLLVQSLPKTEVRILFHIQEVFLNEVLVQIENIGSWTKLKLVENISWTWAGVVGPSKENNHVKTPVHVAH